MSKRPRIYLDHAATTPILPAAKAAMIEAMERWANPSSPHAEGRAARAALEDARGRIKRALGWEGELIFTSGATEAIEIALKRAPAGRRLISAVEHDAVFRAAPAADVLPIGDECEVDLNRLEEELRQADRALVAIQDVNSETGKQQPIEKIAPLIRASGGTLLTDCAQSAGKFPLPDADLLVVSAHKLGGPPGVGALLVRDLGRVEPSGGQEKGYRAGTENLPAILGFAAALESRSGEGWLSQEALLTLSNEVGNILYEHGGRDVGRWGVCSAFIEAWAMPHLSASAQLIRFDLAGIAVSAGSACSSGSLKTSRALTAFGVSDEVASRTIRVSYGWTTTSDDLRAFAQTWCAIARDAGARAA